MEVHLRKRPSRQTDGIAGALRMRHVLPMTMHGVLPMRHGVGSNTKGAGFSTAAAWIAGSSKRWRPGRIAAGKTTTGSLTPGPTAVHGDGSERVFLRLVKLHGAAICQKNWHMEYAKKNWHTFPTARHNQLRMPPAVAEDVPGL